MCRTNLVTDEGGCLSDASVMMTLAEAGARFGRNASHRETHDTNNASEQLYPSDGVGFKKKGGWALLTPRVMKN